ncbi:MAG: 4Fe-4S dicluster domain-containing protein [Nitrososphaerales archaeon]
MVRKGMIIDLKRCVGCDACTVACAMENSTPSDIFWAPVIHQEIGKFPNSKVVFLPTLCMHCEDPPCMKACPTKAIRKRNDGIVLVDEDVCAGHGSCVSACPYGALSLYENQKSQYREGTTPLDLATKSKFKIRTAQKCTFNVSRTDRGLDPACVVACPTQCRIFGDLDDPDSKPNKYVKERGSIPLPLLPELKTKPSVLYLT